ncbi:MAG: response regulator [Candidatus Margulisbacteria bacterium]|nr:response regulator [Candidatus Margulisiibacteriota bacterium]
MSDTILAIDDDPSILEIVKVILSEKGYHIITAESGEKGLKLARIHRPKCILLDVVMPKMSGYMVSAILDKDRVLRKIPLILLTATAQMVGHISLSVKAHHKLLKPFKPEDLLEIVENVMNPIKE